MNQTQYTIKQILKENIVKFVITFFFIKHSLFRKAVFENIRKILNCKQMGWSEYACVDHPNERRLVSHTCKSRFCSTCGAHATNVWGYWLNDNFPNRPAFHITFTLPDDLRNFFYQNRKYLYIIQKASSEAVITWFSKNNKGLPAVSTVLHTFGARLNWHIHIHSIVSTGGLDTQSNCWLSVSSIPEAALKIYFKAILFKYLRQEFINFGITVYHLNDCYKKNWYVNIRVRDDVENVIGYIGRYTKHPPISQRRILSYNKSGITFSYKDYRNETSKVFSCSVFDFIHLFIIHIPEKHQKYIYHYGLMANRVINKYRNILKNIGLLPWKSNIYITWRDRFLSYTKKDPLGCPICKLSMTFVTLVFAKFIDYPNILLRYESSLLR